jgi:SAM-dependent methyltransferase
MGYVYDAAWEGEQARLDALAASYDAGTIAVLSRLGVVRGWRCWEVAAGSGSIAHWLADRVGIDGELLVTDLDPRFVESLRGDHVVVCRHDVRSDPPAVAAFDLVHARAVLAHVPERQRAIAGMVAALRPGGWLVVEDVVFAPRTCDPPLAVLERADAALRRVLQAAHVDPDYGLKIPAALKQAGLHAISSDVRVPLARTGTTDIELLALTLEQLRPRLQTDGALPAGELDETLRALARPGRTISCAQMVAAWGQRPPSGDPPRRAAADAFV